MTVAIAPACVSCGACLWECPDEAITPGEPVPGVEAERCTECLGWFSEPQCAVVCPVAAVVSIPEPVAVLLERFTRLHPGRPLRNTDSWRAAAVCAHSVVATGDGP